MNSDYEPRAMNQRIFQFDLFTETVSAYLLCCGLVDEGKTISVSNLLSIWNSTHASLIASLAALEEKNIVQKMHSDLEGSTYELMDVHEWDCGKT